MNTGLIAFAVGLIASMGLTVPVRQLALRFGMVDHPGPRKVHVQPMPLLGGETIGQASLDLATRAVALAGGRVDNDSGSNGDPRALLAALRTEQ